MVQVSDLSARLELGERSLGALIACSACIVYNKLLEVAP